MLCETFEIDQWPINFDDSSGSSKKQRRNDGIALRYMWLIMNKAKDKKITGNLQNESYTFIE